MSYRDELTKPFKPSEIEWRVGATNQDKTKGIALPYLTNSAIQNRLDEVFGIDGWQNEFREWKGIHQVCGLSCKIDNVWITKWDGAQDTNMEPVKGGLSDSMKRAARMWGIGRYLTNIPNRWYKIKQQGRSYVLDETPKLPDWALPEIKDSKVEWEEPTQVNELPIGVLKCIEAFEPLGVTQQDLENYLHNEASMFDEQNIEELKTVYRQIKKGIKQRDDFFYVETKKNKAQYLTQALLAEANNDKN